MIIALIAGWSSGIPGKSRRVTGAIARIRGIEAGHDSISPNRHPEIDSPGDLLDMIAMVRDITGKPVGFKAVMGGFGWLEDVLWEASSRGARYTPDFITVDSGDGGTGAAPMTLMDHVGLSVRESLPMVVDSLMKTGLRERVRVIASGKLINPVGVAWALCAGADFVTSARGFMFALGCIQAQACHTNECPVGVATQDPKFARGADASLRSG